MARKRKDSSDSDFDEVENIKDLASEYAAGTSMHGIKYLAEPGRALIER